MFEPNHRRVWVPLSEVPEVVQKAFIAAEDKRFYQHAGVDERAVIRAFVTSMGRSGRPQGGSTITQQVVKTLLVGDDVTYERKIREIVIASRVERLLSKQEILELYLNSIYMGRGSWGIEMAAQSYFGKPAKQLTLEEGALLAGLDQGAELLQSRPAAGARAGAARLCAGPPAGRRHHRARRDQAPAGQLPRLTADRRRRDVGFHYVDHLTREAKKAAGITSLTTTSYVVRSTINPAMQRAAEIALQDGLARYEIERRARPLRRGGDEPGRCDQAHRGAAEAGGDSQRGGQAHSGGRRWSARGCRSTTCIGIPPSWWRRAAIPRPARYCGSACATDASCRSPMSGRRCAASSISMT